MEEVNLRDLIETVLRAKWMIAGVTLVAVIVSGVFSLFVLTPTYEATATILVNNPNPTPKPAATILVNDPNPAPKLAAELGLDQLLARLSSTPSMSLETYRTQVTNPAVLTRVIPGLGLKATPEDLAQQVKATAVKDTGLIQVTVTDQDPKQAAAIANRLVQEYQIFISQLTQDQMQKSGQFISDQMTKQEQLLSRAMDELKAFLQQTPSADELKKEIDAKSDLLAQLKTDRVKLDVSIQQASAGVGQAEKELGGAPPVLVTKKSITDDPYLQSLAGSLTQADLLKLSGLSMQSEEVNPARADLTTALAEKRVGYAELVAQRVALDAAVAETEKSLEKLRGEQVAKQITQDKLQQKVDVLKQAYDALAQKYEEARISAASQFAEVTLTVAGQALVPEKPSGPHKALNVALAGVLGLMASVFLAFFLEFWRNTTPTVGAGSPVTKAGGN